MMYIIFFLIWIFFAYLVSFFGIGRKIGGWGTFFISLIFSPLIGLIAALLSKRKSDEYREQYNLRLTEYENYRNTRKENPEYYRNPELNPNQKYVELSATHIPSTELGKPIYISKYFVKNGKTYKEKKKVVEVICGNKAITFTMPFKAKFIKVHEASTYLLPNDILFLVE